MVEKCDNCDGRGYFIYPPVCPGGIEEQEMCLLCLGTGIDQSPEELYSELDYEVIRESKRD